MILVLANTITSKVLKMATKMLSPIKLTLAQHEWLQKEHKRTGNPIAVIVRNLIQEQVEKSDK